MPVGVYQHKPCSEATKIKIGNKNRGRKRPDLAERNRKNAKQEKLFKSKLRFRRFLNGLNNRQKEIVGEASVLIKEYEDAKVLGEI